ncbi:hypothetical protein SKAU_G00394420 [Synaphobranchus kaupii]|uniref:Uncharacterized protein n=1 Tax=Synaphobranchus kaupii TaxID=118154 RepID=A0A9Q1EC58_SYNKA|nr:hypothetical protein SKAU_G00394420 [Synaphobranchus kaupii]
MVRHGNKDEPPGTARGKGERRITPGSRRAAGMRGGRKRARRPFPSTAAAAADAINPLPPGSACQSLSEARGGVGGSEVRVVAFSPGNILKLRVARRRRGVIVAVYHLVLRTGRAVTGFQRLLRREGHVRSGMFSCGNLRDETHLQFEFEFTFQALAFLIGRSEQ